jgi:hypothetical protein
VVWFRSKNTNITQVHKDYLLDPSRKKVDFLRCKLNQHLRFIENFRSLDKCCAVKSLDRLSEFEILPRRSPGQIILDTDIIVDEPRQVLSEVIEILQQEVNIGLNWKIRIEADLVKKLGKLEESLDKWLKDKVSKESKTFDANGKILK